MFYGDYFRLYEFLTVTGLKKSFSGNCVIDIFELGIKRGEIFSVLGPSGCGKTSLLRMIAGFETPDDGVILLDNKDITNVPPHSRKINTVFQNYALFPHLTVRENIAFGPKIACIPEKKINYSVDKMLGMVQLKEVENKKPSEISGGQKQRVAIARALIMKPSVLLLDEPLSALDLKLRQRMLLELDQIHDEVGITFVLITHDQSEAMSISDRIAVMNNGKIEQVGTPPEIYETPVSSFVAAFIGDTNFFQGKIIKFDESSEYFIAEINDFGFVKCYKDKPISIDSQVTITIRPERFYVSLEKPINNNANVIRGQIEEIIYLGHKTKYWIRVGKKLIAVFRQHNHSLFDEQRISWNDYVWLTWSADDSYMLDNYERKDERLLEVPDDV